jgi:hypothetical protein
VVNREKLGHIRAAALGGRLPEGLTPEDIAAYCEDLLADFEALASVQGQAEARRSLRYQLFALKRAEATAHGDRIRTLIRLSEDEGLLSLEGD